MTANARSRSAAATLDGILDALPPGRYGSDRRARTYARVLADALREGSTPEAAQAQAAQSAYGKRKG
jgi:hypothetical protein